ncbi:hypothetical protein ACH5RR_003105 [Cinchona calisaya]|uniref:Uncharacterized protein n=1 Tax=Cinchona calisaya TaxID=153742 RepID=A0ABD3ATV6_9GENT
MSERLHMYILKAIDERGWTNFGNLLGSTVESSNNDDDHDGYEVRWVPIEETFPRPPNSDEVDCHFWALVCGASKQDVVRHRSESLHSIQQ